MPRSGTGGYSLPSGNPVVTGTTISSTDFNNTMTDLATAMAGSLAADGQTAWTGNQNANGNRLTGLTSPSSLTDATTAGATQAGTLTYLTGVAGTNTLTASLALFAAYTTGQSLRFIAPNANTGAVTLNINSAGAVAITKFGTTTLSAGDIKAGATVTVVYDGTRFQIQSVCWTSSLGSNGYEISPTGKVDQWGNTTTNASGLATVTFPIQFPTAPFQILTSLATTTVAAVMTGGATTSNSQATVTASNTSGVGVSVTVVWRAVGS